MVALEDAEAIIWTGDDPELLRRSLHPGIAWVQLCSAGVDTWLDEGVIDHDRVWTAAKGVAARQIAEHALLLMLAAARDLPRRIMTKSWGERGGRELAGSTVGIVGAGEIGRALIGLLEPFDVKTVALTRTGRAVPAATCSVGPGGLDRLLGESDWVVVSAPATPKTTRMIGERELALMRPDAWIICVSRGSIIDTDALVAALALGRIGGAALDATDPEPLPDDHELWQLGNVIITPHVATTPPMHAGALGRRIRENVARFLSAEELVGLVDVGEGY